MILFLSLSLLFLFFFLLLFPLPLLSCLLYSILSFYVLLRQKWAVPTWVSRGTFVDATAGAAIY
jgi:hypothetical protein